MNSFGSRSILRVASHDYEIYRIDALDKQGISTKHLPYSLRILLENLLRTEDGRNVTKDDIRALAAWNSKSKPDKEIAFTPSRVLMQDFTGVPAVVDLAAMRDAMKRLSGDPDVDQSAAAGGIGDRSLGASGRIRHAASISTQCRARIPSATKNATDSCAGARPLFAISPLFRPTPASCIR